MVFEDLLSFGLELDLELNNEDYSYMNLYEVKDLDEQSVVNEVANNPARRELLTPPQLDTHTHKITRNILHRVPWLSAHPYGAGIPFVKTKD